MCALVFVCACVCICVCFNGELLIFACIYFYVNERDDVIDIMFFFFLSLTVIFAHTDTIENLDTALELAARNFCEMNVDIDIVEKQVCFIMLY